MSVTLPNADVVSYAVDGFHRRSSRKLNGTFTSEYLWKDKQLVAELTSAGAFKARFVYGTKEHVPDYMIVGADKYRIVTDHLGSVRMVIKTSDGTIAQKIEYNELGRVLSDTSPGFQPFGFAGGLYDSATGLVRFGARDYDPEVGRWTSKDPILFEGGDTNLYGYVVQDPINFIDPSGQAATDRIFTGEYGFRGVITKWYNQNVYNPIYFWWITPSQDSRSRGPRPIREDKDKGPLESNPLPYGRGGGKC